MGLCVIPKIFDSIKAGLSIGVLELWLFFSILNYYNIINDSNEELSLTSPIIFIPFILIIIVNYITFDHYDDIWKKYNQEFDLNGKHVIQSRSALPLDGNMGGLPEYIIDPQNVRITGFSVLNP